MAKTGGRSRRPLPPSVVQDLTRLGFVYREQASEGRSYFIYQHKRFRSMELHVARANTAGSQDLVWSIAETNARTHEEEMIRRLETLVEFRSNPNVFIEKARQS